MKKFIIVTLMPCIIIASTLAACGGRDANPVMVNQYGDAKMSCERLGYEISNAQNEIQRLLPKRSNTGKNVALGVAGWFFIVPWFFMDFKNANAQEYDAWRMRYNHLVGIAIDKGCDDAESAAGKYPSLQEMKDAYEKHQQEKLKSDSGMSENY